MALSRAQILFLIEIAPDGEHSASSMIFRAGTNVVIVSCVFNVSTFDDIGDTMSSDLLAI